MLEQSIGRDIESVRKRINPSIIHTLLAIFEFCNLALVGFTALSNLLKGEPL